MPEPAYRGNFDQRLVVSHTQVAASDNVDIPCGYLSFIRKIVFGVSAGTVRLRLYYDAARTSLAWDSGTKNNGDEYTTPICFVDMEEDSVIHSVITASPASAITLTMDITRLS